MKFFFCVERELDPDDFSACIMKQIKAPYSHALILVEEIPEALRVRHKLPLSGDIIFHATIPKYCYTTVEKEMEGGRNEIYAKVEIAVDDPVGAVYWLVGNMGKDYSFSQCIGMLDFDLFDDHFKARLAQIWGNDEGRGVCSELPVRFGMACSIEPDYFKGVNPEAVNPKKALMLFTDLAKITGLTPD